MNRSTVRRGTAATVLVEYAGWNVDDGDAEVRVGQLWSVTIELQRPGPVTDDDWMPRLEAAPYAAVPHLDPLGQARYTFIADPVEAPEPGERWSALELAGVRFAVPEAVRGRVRGSGRFVHDTYFIDSPRVHELVTMRLPVLRIQRLQYGIAVDEGTGEQAYSSTWAGNPRSL